MKSRFSNIRTSELCKHLIDAISVPDHLSDSYVDHFNFNYNDGKYWPTNFENLDSTYPTLAPSAANNSCSDSPLKLRFKLDGVFQIRSCSWLAANNHCSSSYAVKSSCASSCGLCYSCVDAKLKFQVEWRRKTRLKNCKWVANKPKNRCRLSGVIDTCRATCGSC